MPQTKTKPAKPAKAERKPKPATVQLISAPANDSELAERQSRLTAYEAEGKQLQELRRFQKLDYGYWDPTCVLALADLLTYAEHCAESMSDASNWLGAFFTDVLLEVAAHGPEWANANPEFVKDKLDKALDNLRDALEFSRDIQSKLPLSVLEQIERCESAPGGAS
jgi:hypothetical protein